MELKYEIIVKHEQGRRVTDIQMQYNFYDMYYSEVEEFDKL